MVEDTLGELRKLLEEEREAILRLDGARVLDMAARKHALVARLRDGSGGLQALPPEAARGLRELVAALRHNGILLAHARDVLRDAISAARAEPVALPPVIRPAGFRAPLAGVTARRALSVRG
jgi:hypothetical protein